MGAYPECRVDGCKQTRDVDVDYCPGHQKELGDVERIKRKYTEGEITEEEMERQLAEELERLNDE